MSFVSSIATRRKKSNRISTSRRILETSIFAIVIALSEERLVRTRETRLKRVTSREAIAYYYTAVKLSNHTISNILTDRLK